MFLTTKGTLIVSSFLETRINKLSNMEVFLINLQSICFVVIVCRQQFMKINDRAQVYKEKRELPRVSLNADFSQNH